MTAASEATQTDVLIAVARVEGKLEAYLTQAARSDEVMRMMQTEVSGLRDRVVAIESARKSSPPWHVTVGALVPVIALVLVLAQQIYSK
jgi:hypothetical protein